MQRYTRVRMLAFVTACVVITVLLAAVFAGRTSGSGKRASAHVHLTLRLNGPAPKQQTAALPGSPGTTPGGPGGPAPSRSGVFSLTGVVVDRGPLRTRLPSLGSTSHESIAVLHGRRGTLRLGLSGGGTSSSGDGGRAHWCAISGSGAYARASGGGSATQTPGLVVLVGSLMLNGR